MTPTVTFTTPMPVTNAACCSSPTTMCARCAAAALAAATATAPAPVSNCPGEPTGNPNWLGAAGTLGTPAASLAPGDGPAVNETPLTNHVRDDWAGMLTNRLTLNRAKGATAPAAPERHPDSQGDEAPLTPPRA
jgi:hypothetical protein